jgi:hypothetical protein
MYQITVVGFGYAPNFNSVIYLSVAINIAYQLLKQRFAILRENDNNNR